MENPARRPIRSTWFIILFSVMILACAETQEVDGGGNIQVTFTNTASWSSKIWINSIESGWVGAGESTVIWVTPGTHYVHYQNSDGSEGAGKYHTLEAGNIYTITMTEQ